MSPVVSIESKGLHECIASGDHAAVARHIEDGADLRAVDEDYGASPLFIAASYGHTSIVESLFKQGIDLTSSEHHGISALHLACREGHLDVAKYLVDHGLDADVVTDEGITPLWFAAEEGHLSIIKWLVREAKVDAEKAKLSDGESPIFPAAKRGHLQILQILVEEGLASVDSRRADGATPLIVACESNKRGVAKYLFAQGATLSLKTWAGIGPLEAARSSGDKLMIGYVEHAMAAVNEGLDYSDFKKHTDAKKVDAERLAHVYRARLRKSPEDGETLFELGISLATLGRDGEAFELFQRAVKTAPNALFAPRAHELTSYITNENIGAAETYWTHITEVLSPRASDILDIKAAYSKAMDLREDEVEEARSLLGRITAHVAQYYGGNLKLREEWLQDEKFPFMHSRSVYGSGLGEDYSCACEPADKELDTVEECALTIAVETGRFDPHPYSRFGQQLLLALRSIPDLCVFVMNPPSGGDWVPSDVGEAWPPEFDRVLMQMPLWPTQQTAYCPDIVFRASSPVDTEPHPCARTKTIVYAHTEFRRASTAMMRQLSFWNETSDAVRLVVPSQWAAAGFINEKINPDIIRILAPALPLPPPSKKDAKAFRKQRGWHKSDLILLHIGNMHGRKDGLPEVLEAFDRTLEWFEEVFLPRCTAEGFVCPKALKLVLKEDSPVRGETKEAEEILELLSMEGIDMEGHLEAGRVEYIEKGFPPADSLALFGAADLYVSPYKASAFNLPVLMAAAAGTPVIVTRGGVTDDTTSHDFALYIESTKAKFTDPVMGEAYLLEPNVHDLQKRLQFAVQNATWFNAAQSAGATYAREKFGPGVMMQRLVSILGEVVHEGERFGSPPGSVEGGGSGDKKGRKKKKGDKARRQKARDDDNDDDAEGKKSNYMAI